MHTRPFDENEGCGRWFRNSAHRVDLDRRGGCGGLGRPVSGWAGAMVKCGAEVSSRDSGLLGLTTPLAAPAFSPLASRVQAVSVQGALQAPLRRGSYFPASGDVAFLRNSKGLLGDPPPPNLLWLKRRRSLFPPPGWFIPAGGRALWQAVIQGRRSLLSGGFSFFCTRDLYSCVSAGRSTRRFDGPGRVGASVPPPRPHLTGKEPGRSRRHAARRRHGSDGHLVAVRAVGRQGTTERTKPSRDRCHRAC